eukprot:GHVS01030256.1.p1 GENE.GHVS01030256.1~~GHVS01030256.1.p1  ORF type:complete len:552 (+),score=137.83 GHVS01030256.1:133-1788(+)
MRYGPPIIAVNLMKVTRDGSSDEPELGDRFLNAIETLNKELPECFHILCESIDIKQTHRIKQNSLPTMLLQLSNWAASTLGYFYADNLRSLRRPLRVQCGVVRSNCVDCLDRTNFAQLSIGITFLAHQLHTIALLPEPALAFDSQVVSVLSELYDLLGDHLSLQYGGSITHKKFTRERPRMMKHSKELLTSITRHYTNTFADSERQNATNLFLGVLQPRIHPRPWLVDGDSWVHDRYLEDNFSPGEWWVSGCQYTFNKLRVLYALPPPVSPAFRPLFELSADNPLWFDLMGGHPLVSRDNNKPTGMYTYVPWQTPKEDKQQKEENQQKQQQKQEENEEEENEEEKKQQQNEEEEDDGLFLHRIGCRDPSQLTSLSKLVNPSGSTSEDILVLRLAAPPELKTPSPPLYKISRSYHRSSLAQPPPLHTDHTAGGGWWTSGGGAEQRTLDPLDQTIYAEYGDADFLVDMLDLAHFRAAATGRGGAASGGGASGGGASGGGASGGGASGGGGDGIGGDGIGGDKSCSNYLTADTFHDLLPHFFISPSSSSSYSSL